MALQLYGDATGNGIKDSESGASLHFGIDGEIVTTLAAGKTHQVKDSAGNVVAEHGGAASGANGSTGRLVAGAGADVSGNDGKNGGDVVIAAGAGGSATTSGNKNGGNGGSVRITLGAKGNKHGSGSDGAAGNLIITNLPTSDPHVVGALYSDTGTIKISAGP